MTATILRAGFLSSVQDLGRFGQRQSGVVVGGALDSHALKVANFLVGNGGSAAGIEVTLGKMRIKFDDERLVSWAGGEFGVRVGKTELAAGRAGLVGAGEELSLEAQSGGGRAWVAISGGIDVPLVLGSRSTDLRSGFGGYEGRALHDGDALPFGRPSADALRIAQKIGGSRIAPWGAASEWVRTAPHHPFLRIVRGCDWSQFDDPALIGEAFTVTSDSDRMGLRLDGPKLEARSTDDLVSEAVVPGTIQVPPSGQPIVLLGDCQTIGGYPKIAHVATVDLPIAAQLQPGDAVRFAEVSLSEAKQLILERERDLRFFRVGLELHTS